MAEEDVVVPSAVVVPDMLMEDAETLPHGLKRRASSTSDASSKRPKTRSNNQPEDTQKPAIARRGMADADERKRGKRLFGGLLGALSQNSASSMQKRRRSIDRKQREKLKPQAEEELGARNQHLEELKSTREAEVVVWKRQALKTKYENERILARFLRTKTRPFLYYKPWELRPEEEELVEKQIIDVESKIAPESDENSSEQQDRPLQDVDMDGDSQSHSDGPNDPTKAIDDNNKQNSTASELKGNGVGVELDQDTSSPPTGQGQSAIDDQPSTEALKDHIDETGEDVVQGDEDAVLY